MPPLPMFSGQVRIFRNLSAKSLNKRTFANARRACNADADAVTRVGQTLFDDLLREVLMFRFRTFNQRNRLAQHNAVALQNAFDVRRY